VSKDALARQDELNQSKLKIQNFIQEIENLNKELDACKLSLDQLNIEIDDLKLAVSEEQSISEGYLREWDIALKKKDIEIETLVATNQKRITELQESLDQSNKKVLDLISGQKAMTAHHQMTYEAIKSQSAISKEKFDELEMINNNLETRSKEEITTLKSRLKESVNSINLLSEREKSLKFEIDNLQLKLDQGQNVIRKYTEIEPKLRGEVDDLKLKLEESQALLDKSRMIIEEGEGHKRTSSELKTKLETAKKGRMDTVKTMDNIKNGLGQIIDQTEEKCRNLETALQTLTTEHKKLQKEFISETKQLQELTETAKQKEKELQKSINELALLTKKFTELSSENSQTSVSYSKTKIEFEKLTTLLNEEAARHARLEREYELKTRGLQ
jgi:chromosome segregation ATPase